MVPDGCGGMLACQPCACTPSTFATDCPAGPCTVATGCQNNTCVYGPASCDSAACSTCALASGPDGGCAASDLRGCGAASCATTFCDPSPVLMGNRVVYRNQCVARTAVRCGLCELGGLECTDAGVACTTPVIPEVNLQRLECDGASPAATVVFCDPAFDGGMATGARSAPYRSFQEALGEASRRGSRGVIIGGSPLLAQTLVVQNGVSVLGGFAQAPSFVRDVSQRPVFQPVVSYFDGGVVLDGGVFGVVATGITTGTLLANVTIRVPPLMTPAPVATPGANSIGAYVNAAPALAVAELMIEVGRAQEGGRGSAVSSPVAVTPVSRPGVPGACPGFGNTVVIHQGGVGQASTCDGTVVSATRGGDGVFLIAELFAVNTIRYSHWTSGVHIGPTRFQPGNASNGALFGGPAAPGAGSLPALVQWELGVPRMRGTGLNGTPGAPGPGGEGAYANVGASVGCDPTFFVPGAAGGAGGCGGRGGLGGQPGGIAAGLVIAGPTPPVLAGPLTITLPARANGGAGSAGSTGTPGVAGAQPPPPVLGLAGGRGADGQTGGTGAPGAPGFARGVLCERPHTLSLNTLRITGPADAGTSDGGFLEIEGCL
jgi:hypothetical protein